MAHTSVRYSLCILSYAYSALFKERDKSPTGFYGTLGCSWNNMHWTCLLETLVSSIYRLFGVSGARIGVEAINAVVFEPFNLSLVQSSNVE